MSSDKTYKINFSAIDKMSPFIKEMNTSIHKLNKNTEMFHKKLKGLKSEPLNKLNSKISKIDTNFIKANRKVSDLNRNFKSLNVSPLSRKINKVNENIEKLPRTFKKSINKMNQDSRKLSMSAPSVRGAPGRSYAPTRSGVPVSQKAGQKISKGVGQLAAGGALVYGVSKFLSAGVRLETQMARVRGLMGASAEDFKKIQDKTVELAGKTEFTSVDVGKGFEYATMAGMSMKEQLKAMPAFLDLATASQMDLGEAVDITTNIMGPFGIEAKDTSRVTDILTMASKSANTNVSELGMALRNVAPAANILNVSLEETAGMLGVLANAGLKSTISGTNLKIIFNRLVDKKKMLREMGVEIEDQYGDLRKAPAILGDLQDKLSKMGSVKKTSYLSAIFGTEASASAAVLLQSVADKSEKGLGGMIEKMENAKGAAKDIRKIIEGTMEYKMKLIVSSLDRLSSKMTQAFRPIIVFLTDMIKGFTDWMSEYEGVSSALFYTIGVIGLINAAMGVFNIVTGFVGKGLANVGKVLRVFGLGRFLDYLGKINVKLALQNALFKVGRGIKAAYFKTKLGFSKMGDWFKKIDLKLAYTNTKFWIAGKAKLAYFKVKAGAAHLLSYFKKINVGLAATKVKFVLANVAKKAFTTFAGAGAGVLNFFKKMNAGLLISKIRLIALKAVQLGIILATKAWAAVQWILNAACLANPILLTITLVIAAIVLLVVYWDEAVSAIGAVWEWFISILVRTRDWFVALVQENAFLMGVFNVLKTVVMGVYGAFKWVWDILVGIWNFLLGDGDFGKIFASIAQVIGSALGWLKTPFEAVYGWIVGIWDSISAFFTKVSDSWKWLKSKVWGDEEDCTAKLKKEHSKIMSSISYKEKSDINIRMASDRAVESVETYGPARSRVNFSAVGTY